MDGEIEAQMEAQKEKLLEYEETLHQQDTEILEQKALAQELYDELQITRRGAEVSAGKFGHTVQEVSQRYAEQIQELKDEISRLKSEGQHPDFGRRPKSRD